MRASLSYLNLFITIPLNSLSGSSSVSLSLGIIAMELVISGQDMPSFFSVFVSALRLLHQKLVDSVSFSFLPHFLPPFHPSFFFPSYFIYFFSQRQLQCLESQYKVSALPWVRSS